MPSISVTLPCMLMALFYISEIELIKVELGPQRRLRLDETLSTNT